MRAILLIAALLITGCTANPDSIINQLRLDDNETGSICVRGTFDASSNPFVTALVIFVYRETTEGVEPEDC